jgi:hypothetical protein
MTWNFRYGDDIDVACSPVDNAEQVEGGSADYRDTETKVVGRQQLADGLKGAFDVTSIPQLRVFHGGISVRDIDLRDNIIFTNAKYNIVYH